MGRSPRHHRQDQERAHLGSAPATLTGRQGRSSRGRPGSGAGAGRSILLGLAALGILAFGYLQGWLGAGGDLREQIAVEPGQTLEAEVTRVVDGDTVVVDIEGTEERLRYIGIDTPESVTPGHPVECYGPEASEYNARMVDGRSIELKIGAEPRDHYGRLLGYIWVGDLFVNAELLRSGYATTLTIPPNDRFATAFDQIERQARSSGVGKWTACR